MTVISKILSRIDGRGYKAYRDLQGQHDFNSFILFVDHVQGDPFAPPSRCRARVPAARAGFPESLVTDRAGCIGMEDYLARSFARVIGESEVKNNINIDVGKQEILERSAIVFHDDYVEVRFSMQLPARGRTILGKTAEQMICRRLPPIVLNALCWENIDQDRLRRHIEANRLQEHLRQQLYTHELVAFIADGSILPRESGTSARPLTAARAVPFSAPQELAVELKGITGEKIRGMGIPEGVTLVVGGGYHGKSTLLQSIERGVYNHIPGDGRDYVVTRSNAVKIRAEDGRRVTRVNISPFINDLPGGKSTVDFDSEDASGSTSQAANIMEALETGSELLLMDEDTSATNFMIRDGRMQALVSKEKEPITPFIDRVRSLYRDLKVSTLLVLGGSGDYLDVADTVIMLDEYRPRIVTPEARQIAARFNTGRRSEGGTSFGPVRNRIPDPASLNPQKGHKVKIGARGTGSIQFGHSQIDLSAVEQLLDSSQSWAIGDLIFFMVKGNMLDGKRNLKDALHLAFAKMTKHGLDIISPFYGQHPGEYAMPRPQEVAAAINRFRSLRIND